MYVCVCAEVCWGISIRRSKDEIINYICYLNEIQKVSSQIKHTHSTKTIVVYEWDRGRERKRDGGKRVRG